VAVPMTSGQWGSEQVLTGVRDHYGGTDRPSQVCGNYAVDVPTSGV
jgi:hypothetical protein